MSSVGRRVAVIVLALVPLVAVAARSSGGDRPALAPTASSGVSNLSGTWTGTAGWTTHENRSVDQVTIAIEQEDRAVTGTLTSTSPAHAGWGGTIHGTVAGDAPDTHFVGTIALRAPAPGGGTCTGSAVFSGRSAADSLRWETSRLTMAATGAPPGRACRGLLGRVVLILGRG